MNREDIAAIRSTFTSVVRTQLDSLPAPQYKVGHFGEAFDSITKDLRDGDEHVWEFTLTCLAHSLRSRNGSKSKNTGTNLG